MDRLPGAATNSTAVIFFLQFTERGHDFPGGGDQEKRPRQWQVLQGHTSLWEMKDWLGSELASVRTLDAEGILAHHIRSSSHEGCDRSDLA